MKRTVALSLLLLASAAAPAALGFVPPAPINGRSSSTSTSTAAAAGKKQLGKQPGHRARHRHVCRRRDRSTVDPLNRPFNHKRSPWRWGGRLDTWGPAAGAGRHGRPVAAQVGSGSANPLCLVQPKSKPPPSGPTVDSPPPRTPMITIPNSATAAPGAGFARGLPTGPSKAELLGKRQKDRFERPGRYG